MFLQQQDVGSNALLDDKNVNLTKPQKELLLDHYRMGHFNFPHLRRLYKGQDEKGRSLQPCISPRFPSMTTCDIPLCIACQIAKAKRQPTKVKVNKDIAAKQNVLSTGDIFPGDNCSVDQYESSVRGRLPNATG